MTPEQRARANIDHLLHASGWTIQDRSTLDRSAGQGVAVREFPLSTGTADYLLFVDRVAVGVLEAKSEGTTLSGVAEQSSRYAYGLPDHIPHVQEPLPIVYESTGVETYFRDGRDPDPRSRRVFSFHRPRTLSDWLAEPDTLLRLSTGILYAQGVKASVLFFDRKPASEDPWTQKLWILDLRANQHFTLRTNPLGKEHLQDFVRCYHAENRHDRQESERFRAFTYEELVQRDKVSLDIFWLKDESLEDLENLPDPEVLAAEIVEDLETALEQFRALEEELGEVGTE